jgi:FHS family L-fucose permease-like MFS transporter
MAGFAQSSSYSPAADTPENANYRFALVTLTSLFFIMGFITCLNDILIPHLKNVFSLNYTQAMLIQFCFFGAYGLTSVPAGALVKKIGYQRGIVISLVIAAAGCLLFYPAAAFASYPLFLGALFILACGLTLLQVSANPYVTRLGPVETASSRLTLNQAFNSLGTTLAPFFGALLILSTATVAVSEMSDAELAAFRSHEAEAVQLPYMLLASAFFILATVFSLLKLPVIIDGESKSEKEQNQDAESAWQYRHLVLGAVGIFVYVGAEVSIGSFLVNFLGEPHIVGLQEADAAPYIAYYWGGAMVGRFIGAALMTRIPAGAVLAASAVMAGLLVTVAMSTSGSVAMWAILAVGLFNSIMFPTIFSLAVQGLGRHTSQGSGILCTAIVGGAIIPVMQGAFADNMGVQAAFFLPVICYVYIVYYGLRGSRPTNR